MRYPRPLVRTAALGGAVYLGIACGGLGEPECVIDGGGISVGPREVPFTEGNKTINAGERDWRNYDRVVHCSRIKIDSVARIRPEVTVPEQENLRAPAP